MIEGQIRRDEGGKNRRRADVADDRDALPNSAQAKPPIESRTIAIRISDGTGAGGGEAPITPIRITKTAAE